MIYKSTLYRSCDWRHRQHPGVPRGVATPFGRERDWSRTGAEA